MYEVIMYDGGIYRSDELFELIEDVGGVVLMKNRSSQMLTVTMSIPSEDREVVEALCKDIGGQVKEVPLAGTEIAIIGPTLGRHHMPHPICDIAEYLRRCGAVTVVMGLSRGRGKNTSQISLAETSTIDEYDACVFMLGNFKPCVEFKADLILSKIDVPTVLICGPKPDSDKEQIPFTYEGGINAFIENEVKPYSPTSYIKEGTEKVGYELSFTKYFYQPI